MFSRNVLLQLRKNKTMHFPPPSDSKLLGLGGWPRISRPRCFRFGTSADQFALGEKLLLVDSIPIAAEKGQHCRAYKAAEVFADRSGRANLWLHGPASQISLWSVSKESS
jgi:hypothetical protein